MHVRQVQDPKALKGRRERTNRKLDACPSESPDQSQLENRSRALLGGYRTWARDVLIAVTDRGDSFVNVHVRYDSIDTRGMSLDHTVGGVRVASAIMSHSAETRITPVVERR
jgi:hypothetical protein